MASPLVDPRATWGATFARLYDALVARGQEPLYRALCLRAPRLDAGQLLDVGCGPGHAALLLAHDRPGLRITGVDSSLEMVRLAVRRAFREGTPNVEFVHGDAMALPFDEGRFDAAFSLASIKHWPDRPRGLREIFRVLSPGGVAVVIEADRAAPTVVLDRYARNWPWLPAPALRVAFRGLIARDSLDCEEARRLVDASPFRGGEVERLPDMPLLLMRAQKRAAL